MDGISFDCSHNSAFRVRGIVADEMENLKNTHLAGYKYRVGNLHTNPSLKVLVVPLHEEVQPELIKNIISSLTSYIGHEFYISTCNNQESFIIELGSHVCELIKEIGGGISFSYTYSGNENE